MLNTHQRRLLAPTLRLMICAGLAACLLQAAPPLTTIQDTLYRADGSLYTGNLQIEWKSFQASDNTTVPAQSITLRIYRGQFKTQLVPTTTASVGASYTVSYYSDGRLHAKENWAVPPAASAIRVADVRVPGSSGGSNGGSTGGGGGGTAGSVTIADVPGLQDALDARPRMGVGYTPGRTAVINGLGEIDGALGAGSDCVTVEGAGSICSSVVGSVTFVDGDGLVGNVNGTNPTFSLAHAPGPASSLAIYRNGVLQKFGTDFTATGASVTFLSGSIPKTGDILTASYRLSSSSNPFAEIVCSAAGTSTTATSLTSLGTCAIPANLLAAGDRLEISADLTHEGTSQGYTVASKFGAFTLQTLSSSAGEGFTTVRAELGLASTTAYYGIQSWGASTGQAQAAGNISSLNYTLPINVDFQAALSAAGANTVTLRNFTVRRLPAH